MVNTGSKKVDPKGLQKRYRRHKNKFTWQCVGKEIWLSNELCSTAVEKGERSYSIEI